jgi:hypothetical protein
MNRSRLKRLETIERDVCDAPNAELRELLVAVEFLKPDELDHLAALLQSPTWDEMALAEIFDTALARCGAHKRQMQQAHQPQPRLGPT